MSDFRRCYALVAAAMLVAGATPLPAEEGPGWPREIRTDNTTIVIYQPQVDSWVEYQHLAARVAVTITPDDQAPILGALRIRGVTKTDFETREVYLSELEVTEARFPSLPDEHSPKWQRHLEEHLPLHTRTIALDRMLAMVEMSNVTARSTEVSMEPPPIFVSNEPAILVLVDGDAMLAPIEGTTLSFAINTNWDLLYDTSSERYFLLNEGAWLTADAELGDWKAATELPADMSKIPDEENWTDVRAALPLKPSESAIPAVFTSTRPAELIVVDGDPEMSGIEGTHLLWVTNTDADLFFQSDESAYYLLVSGRWFRTISLSRGEWKSAELIPTAFAAIPAEHAKSHVRTSVQGTSEAEQAALQAQIPTTAEVNRSDATLDVTYNGDPEFKSIEGTEMAYAVNSSFDVIRVGDLYYCCFQAIWFVSTTENGPWVACDSVPPVIYEIPASEPVHRVTYVYVYSSTPSVIVCGYTWGYHGMYVHHGVVVYGTGYYYPPYWYPAHYPVYYPYPYSYGISAWYDPYHGAYVRGGTVYGPYGGYGRGASYNPHTGTYARGAAAWGPSGGTWAAEAYNPYRGTHAATRQSANSYEHWGQSVATRGNDWVRTGHYANKDGQAIAGFETSGGARGVAVRGDAGSARVVKDGDDLYVGRDGDVYRKDGDNWSRYDDGDWSQVDRSERAGRSVTDEQRAELDSKRQESGREPVDSAERNARREQAQERTGDRTRDGSLAGADRAREQAKLQERDRSREQKKLQERDRSRTQQLDRERNARREGARRTERFKSSGGDRSRGGGVRRSGGGRRGGGGGRRR